MTYSEKKIEALSEKTRKKAELEVGYAELKKKRKTAKVNVAVLEAQAHNEQVDVENLEERTLTSAIYGFFGKKEQKLEKEREEARDALAKRDAAKAEFDEIDAEIAICEREIQNCDAQYRATLDEAVRSVKSSGISGDEYLEFLTEALNVCRDEMVRADDALTASQNVSELAKEVLSELSEAEELASFDVVGGGLLLKAQKHGRIGEAQMLYSKLRKEVELLRGKLEEMDIKPSVSAAEDDLMDVVGFAWDNFFTNWSIIEEIDGAQSSVQELYVQISGAQKLISAYRYDLELENTVLQSAMDEANGK